MKTLLFAAAAVLAVSAGTAFAGEGAGDPFPFRAPGVTTTITLGRAVLPPANTDPFPFRGDGTIITQTMSSQSMAGSGAEAGMDTLNSLPKGFSNGTPAYAENQRVVRYLASRVAPAANQQLAHNPAPTGAHG